MYLAVKSLHLISLVAWFAGLFYIFRLFVYHRQNFHEEKMNLIFQGMERRLLNYITVPAAVLTLVTGSLMLWLNPYLLQQPWIHAKLTAVLGLWAYQFYSHYTRKRFAKGDFFLTEKACRMINEVPTLFLVIIIPLAILKPWA